MILYFTGGEGVWRGAKWYYIIIEWPLIYSTLRAPPKQLTDMNVMHMHVIMFMFC